MPKIKLEILTPVHIGSGNFLSENTDFLSFKEDDEKIIAILDHEKVLGIIGKEKENIGVWMDIIANKSSLKEYLLQREKDLSSADIEKRIIYVYGNNTKTLKPRKV